MVLIILLSISMIIAFLIGIRQKDVCCYLIVCMSSFLFAFVVMCIVFLLLKFNGNVELIFPDEMLYVNDSTSQLFFSRYVQFFDKNFSLDVVRWINITLFNISLAFLASEISSYLYGRTRLFCSLLAITGTIVGGYWAFFILKEAFSVAALSMLIVSYIRKSKVFLVFASCLLFFARPELLLLYIAITIAFYFKRKNTHLYYLAIVTSMVCFILFMNSEYSYSIKLFTLSRRFGESEFEFDDVAITTSNLSFFPFIMSEPFRQAVMTNINSTFNPFLDLNPLVVVQRLYNIIGFYIFLTCVKPYLMKDKLYSFAFIVLLGVLFTHSVYRYFNTILIPFSLYFLFLKY
ncbi:O115 family O-antigen polymerase, partial [Escherichia coli]